MDGRQDLKSTKTMTSSLVTENCLICCAKTDCEDFFRGDRTETRYLDTAYVGLPILLVIGL